MHKRLHFYLGGRAGGGKSELNIPKAIFRKIKRFFFKDNFKVWKISKFEKDAIKINCFKLSYASFKNGTGIARLKHHVTSICDVRLVIEIKPIWLKGRAKDAPNHQRCMKNSSYTLVSTFSKDSSIINGETEHT